MRKTRNRILIGLAVAATVALLVWAFAPRPLPVETATATVGRFERSIDEDARTRVRDRYVISAPLAGQVSRISLREGDAVAPDTVVATLTPALSPMLDARSEAELAARVETADAAVARARTSLAQARDSQRRSEGLARDRFISASQLQNDRLAVRAAEQELASAEQDRHVAGHELEQARTAPSAGTVALGAPLIELGDLAQLEIVAELLTGDALQTPPGTPVRIERWGGTGTLNGRVRRVEPAGFTKVSALGVEEQRVNVLIELTDPPERWRALGDGYRVAVRLLVVAQDKVLTVPVGAVFPRPGGDGDGTAPAANAASKGGAQPMAVFVIADGRARQREVTVADRNGREAWIASGLRAGERVIVYPGDAIVDGVRVEERGLQPARR